MTRLLVLWVSFAAGAAWACGVDVAMKVIGFDKAGERALVRVETTGEVETIEVKVVDLRTGKEGRGSTVIVDRDDPPAQRQKLRAQRWKQAQAALERDGFTITPDLAPLPATGFAVGGGLQLVLEGVHDADLGFSGNSLVLRRGEEDSDELFTLSGPPSDSPRIGALYLSPKKTFVLATEAGCVNGTLHVFEVAKLRKHFEAPARP